MTLRDLGTKVCFLVERNSLRLIGNFLPRGEDKRNGMNSVQQIIRRARPFRSSITHSDLVASFTKCNAIAAQAKDDRPEEESRTAPEPENSACVLSARDGSQVLRNIAAGVLFFFFSAWLNLEAPRQFRALPSHGCSECGRPRAEARGGNADSLEGV